MLRAGGSIPTRSELLPSYADLLNPDPSVPRSYGGHEDFQLEVDFEAFCNAMWMQMAYV
jgi:hypothetical protein